MAIMFPLQTENHVDACIEDPCGFAQFLVLLAKRTEGTQFVEEVTLFTAGLLRQADIDTDDIQRITEFLDNLNETISGIS